MVWAGLPAYLMSYLSGAESVRCKQLCSEAECCAAEARITNEPLRTAAAFVSSAMQALAGKSFSHVASLRVCHPLQALLVSSSSHVCQLLVQHRTAGFGEAHCHSCAE